MNNNDKKEETVCLTANKTGNHLKCKALYIYKWSFWYISYSVITLEMFSPQKKPANLDLLLLTNEWQGSVIREIAIAPLCVM